MASTDRGNAEINWDDVPDHFAEILLPISRLPLSRFAVDLRAAREKAVLTRAQLAKLSGVHLSTIIRLEQGLQDAEPAAVAALAAALQINVDQLKLPTI
jgi:DNA-binding XRE family transcriptional regulator